MYMSHSPQSAEKARVFFGQCYALYLLLTLWIVVFEAKSDDYTIIIVYIFKIYIYYYYFNALFNFLIL